MQLTEEQLAILRESMTDAEFRFLAPLLVAIRQPVKKAIDASSDIVTISFDACFTRRLCLFHALHDPKKVLQKHDFEFAFKEAMEYEGQHTVELTKKTFPGSDAIVDGTTGFSLKTEAEAGIRPDRIKISKLMESAWTKDLGSIQEFRENLHRITDHLKKYQRILTLRAFGRYSSGRIQYDLVEIPSRLLLEVRDAEEDDFTPLTRAGSTTLSVRHGSTLAFQVVFDGSDQKITIRNLRVDLCLKHGTWIVEHILGDGSPNPR